MAFRKSSVKKLLLIVIGFICVFNLGAQTGLTFDKVISVHAELQNKVVVDTPCYSKYNVTRSKSILFDSDTLIVPAGKCWKIEFLDIKKNISGPAVIGINGCSYTYSIGSDVLINNVIINLNYPVNTPIWLKAGDKIMLNLDSRDVPVCSGCQYYGVKSTTYSTVTYHLSALEFSVQ